MTTTKKNYAAASRAAAAAAEKLAAADEADVGRLEHALADARVKASASALDAKKARRAVRNDSFELAELIAPVLLDLTGAPSVSIVDLAPEDATDGLVVVQRRAHELHPGGYVSGAVTVIANTAADVPLTANSLADALDRADIRAEVEDHGEGRMGVTVRLAWLPGLPVIEEGPTQYNAASFAKGLAQAAVRGATMTGPTLTVGVKLGNGDAAAPVRMAEGSAEDVTLAGTVGDGVRTSLVTATLSASSTRASWSASDWANRLDAVVRGSVGNAHAALGRITNAETTGNGPVFANGRAIGARVMRGSRLKRRWPRDDYPGQHAGADDPHHRPAARCAGRHD